MGMSFLKSMQELLTDFQILIISFEIWSKWEKFSAIISMAASKWILYLHKSHFLIGLPQAKNL